MPVTIAVISGKGGVGKTTVAATLAASLGARGLRVLAVDLDGQGNLAQALGVPRGRIRWTMADVLRDDLEIGDVILHTVAPGVDIAPAGTAVFDSGEELRDRTRRFQVLRSRLRHGSDAYDIVLIDSPPALGFHTTSALAAADYALVPTQVSGFALGGLNDSLELISKVAREENPDLRLLGLLPTFLDRDVSAHREVLRALHRLNGIPQFDVVIPYDAVFSETSLLGLPVQFHAPESAGARAFAEAAAELERRLASAGSPLPTDRLPVAARVPEPLSVDELETQVQPGPRRRGGRWWPFGRPQSAEGARG